DRAPHRYNHHHNSARATASFLPRSVESIPMTQGGNHKPNARKPARKPAARKPEPQPAPAEPQAQDLRAYQDWYEYERRLERPMMMKLAEFQRDERLRHVIFSQQFNRSILDRISQVTTKMHEIGETREGLAFLSSLLRYKR